MPKGELWRALRSAYWNVESALWWTAYVNSGAAALEARFLTTRLGMPDRPKTVAEQRIEKESGRAALSAQEDGRDG